VGAIKREPTPSGPISDLFNRLDELHSRAGRPSMREIALRAGRGNISSSTVHNIFRSSRVPRWEFLEHVVLALGGDQSEREVFLTLWQVAWRVENEVDVVRESSTAVVPTPGRVGIQFTPWHTTVAFAREPQQRVEAAPRQPQRVWSNEIPQRNHDFTGRLAELEKLYRNLNGEQLPHTQVVAGMGGIGKTELVTEYIHRNIEKYEIIWWIRAEHHDRVRDALVKLGQRLELRQASPDGSRDRTITAVLEELRSGVRSWLLIYDNAVNPTELEKYLPASRPGGHVIITSRELNWPSYLVADGIELQAFTEDDAVSFLRRRVRGLAQGTIREPLTREEDTQRATDAGRLAQELGYLPIALNHAAAYLAETRQSVYGYIAKYTQNAHQLLSEQLWEADLPAHVSGTWAMSTTLLTPDAKHLFNLCAFFSPEPIAAELFMQDTASIDDPPGLGEFLSSAQRFRAAETQLHRLCLAKVDGARDLIEMHRVVQAVTRGRLRQEGIDRFHAYRAAVDIILAKSDPGNPDHDSNDVIYDLSLQHLESDRGFLHTENPALRDLIIHQVRRLHLRGSHVEAAQFGEDALAVWRDRFGEDDLQVLTLTVEVAIAMYWSGRAADAHELVLRIRPRLQRYTDGDGFKVLLLCDTFYGADLRSHGQFREALELNLSTLERLETVFGPDHERALNVRNNIGILFRQLGRFHDALEMDRTNVEVRVHSRGLRLPEVGRLLRHARRRAGCLIF
jgi:hypothetical protein